MKSDHVGDGGSTAKVPVELRAYLAAIGRKGGQSKSPRKAAQSRANGAKRKKQTIETQQKEV